MVKPVVSFNDFARLDLRVGTVRVVEDIEGSDKLYRLTVDLGPEYGTRTVIAGVKTWYDSEDISGKQFVFVANLEARKIMGAESQGMMLATEADGKAVLIPVPHDAPNGSALR